MAEALTAGDVRHEASDLGLAGRPVCLHSSFRSFGPVDGGPAAIVNGLRGADVTLVVPTFSFDRYGVDPAPGTLVARNGWPAGTTAFGRAVAPVYSVDSNDVDARMGAIPAEVLRRAGRRRGHHPLCSFSAIGPLAARIVDEQRPHHVYAPLEQLAAAGGAIVLAGIGLERMTLIHLAEQRAGRAIFQRWVTAADGRTGTCEVGGCSSGFPNLDEQLAHVEHRTEVGSSPWRLYDAGAVLDVASNAIAMDPAITHCDARCVRCDDAVAGGPTGARLSRS